METRRFQVIIEQDEDGVYIAEAPALQGCFTQGDTFEEVVANIKDAIAVCLEELADEGVEIDSRYPEIISIKFVEVPVTK